ncbi:MAG TPA: twin-arginine translocation signal domain-containing protein, partial [Burkholderiales bacterium]|nr:twin-arginine translocation signal domain-containing protein [Burkholderiales bacterium]
MTTRRDFMQQAAGAAAGVLFTTCGLLDAAQAQNTVRRRQVMVGGKRVKTIDVHAHCVIPEAMTLTGQKITGDLLPR